VAEIFIIYILGATFGFFIHLVGLIMFINRRLSELNTVLSGFIVPDGKGGWPFGSGVVSPTPFSSSNCHLW
jgi:hypothetical protein